MTTLRVPLAAARAVVLHAQRLNQPNGQESAPTPEAIFDVVRALGAIQLDTLQMVARAHYLAVWSRLGVYNPADLDGLAYADGLDGQPNPRRLFEDWYHAACLLPLEEYRYRLYRKALFRRRDPLNSSEWWRNALGDLDVEDVLASVTDQGARHSGDFEYNGPKRGAWWDWKPSKAALEHLFSRGDLLVARRDRSWQRVYDLTERVLPDWVERSDPGPEATILHLLEQSVRAFGLCPPASASDAVNEVKRGEARPYIETLMAQGVFVPVTVERADGTDAEWIVHRARLPELEQAADGGLPARRTTFLSPFDNLWWVQGRDAWLWNFTQRLEAYKPPEQRIWGYYCLPILHHDRLVGRFDPKLERARARLTLRAMLLEDGVSPDEALASDVAGALRDFMAFHGARELVIEKSRPDDFGRRVLQAL